MGPLFVFALGALAAVGIGVGYNVAVDQHKGTFHGLGVPPVSSTTPTPEIYTTPTPEMHTTETPLTSLRISQSEPFAIRSAALSRIIKHSNNINRGGRPTAIWKINTASFREDYNGDTQRAIHHFIPGDQLRNTFYRELNRPASEWTHLVQMLRVAVENLQAVPSNQLVISSYEIQMARLTAEMLDERVTSTRGSIYDFDVISQGLDTLYGIFFWSPCNLFVGPLPQQRQPVDQGNKLDVQLMPVMTRERSKRLRNLYEYFTSERNLDDNAVIDYVVLTVIYATPTNSGPWRPISRTLDEYFRELVRISRRQDQPPVSEAVDALSGNQDLIWNVNSIYRMEAINALQVCDKCKDAVSSLEKYDCKRKKCPFYIKNKNTYYILDTWYDIRSWIESLLNPEDEVTPRFSMPDDVIKQFFNCHDDDKDDGGGSCSRFIALNENYDESQDIEHFDRAFTQLNPDMEFTKMRHLSNQYLQPFGNALIMSSLNAAVVSCLVLLHNNPLRAGMVSTKNRRRRYRADENDIDVKYNSKYLLKLAELIHQDMNNSVDESSIFKQLVTDTTSPDVQSSFNRVCH